MNPSRQQAAAHAPNSPQPDSGSPSVAAHLLLNESGQDLIEYALVAALIGLGAVVALRGLGTRIAAAYTSIGTTLTSNT